jgi:hypothetical protein
VIKHLLVVTARVVSSGGMLGKLLSSEAHQDFAKSCQNGSNQPHLLASGVLRDKSFTNFCWERLGAVCFDNHVQHVAVLHMTILEVLKPRKAQVVEGDVEHNPKSVCPAVLGTVCHS